MTLLIIALAPVALILTYIYFRDKYQKEPLGQLARGFAAGVLIVIPCLIMEHLLSAWFSPAGIYSSAAWNAFVVAAFTEELWKYIALVFLFWSNRYFDERFDGIVYAVFVSLGFAAIENILYVYNHGHLTGLFRAFSAVPAHALFGIVMGLYLGLAKFHPGKKGYYLWAAFVFPWLFHGI